MSGCVQADAPMETDENKAAAANALSSSPRNSSSFAPDAIGALDADAPPIDVPALFAHNRELGDYADRRRMRAAEQDLCLQQATQVLALGAVMSLGELDAPASTLVARVRHCTDKLEAVGFVTAHTDALIAQLEQFCVAERRVLGTAAQRCDDAPLARIERGSRARAASSLVQTLRTVHTMRIERAKKRRERDDNLRQVYTAMRDNFARHFDPTHFGIVIDERGGDSDADDACLLCSNAFDGAEPRRRRVLLECCQMKQSCCVECLMRTAYTSSNYARKSFFSCAFCRAELRTYGQLEPRAR